MAINPKPIHGFSNTARRSAKHSHCKQASASILSSPGAQAPVTDQACLKQADCGASLTSEVFWGLEHFHAAAAGRKGGAHLSKSGMSSTFATSSAMSCPGPVWPTPMPAYAAIFEENPYQVAVLPVCRA